MYAAAFHGHLEIVKQLVAARADPDVATSEDIRPIHGAAYTGQVEVWELLLRPLTDPWLPPLIVICGVVFSALALGGPKVHANGDSALMHSSFHRLAVEGAAGSGPSVALPFPRVPVVSVALGSQQEWAGAPPVGLWGTARAHPEPASHFRGRGSSGKP